MEKRLLKHRTMRFIGLELSVVERCAFFLLLFVLVLGVE
jgi:hypothetical protein